MSKEKVYCYYSYLIDICYFCFLCVIHNLSDFQYILSLRKIERDVKFTSAI